MIIKNNSLKNAIDLARIVAMKITTVFYDKYSLIY